jgi:glycosyltransferase involved in cell wall biosynthesis
MSTSYSPKVSIGLPVYNGENYLASAIESILAQTFGDFELIICDNASTDQTREICRGYVKRDHRIRYFRHKRNIGATSNFNSCLALSTGEYFKWMAHDDMLHPDFLARCVDALDADPNAVLCQSLVEYIDENGRGFGIYDSCLAGADSSEASKRFRALVLLPHPCNEIFGLIRCQALAGSIQLGNYYLAEYVLLGELALRGRFIQIHKPLQMMREHTDRATRAMNRLQVRLSFNNPKRARQIDLPVWRCYGKYFQVVAKHLRDRRTRLRCYKHLLSWWFVNLNWARMAVDLLALVEPEIIPFAERFKRKKFGPPPGPLELMLKETGGKR